jgi:hypothetical protein
MPAQIEGDDIAGAVVSVVKDARIFFAKGYGFSDVETWKPDSPSDTLFRPGSGLAQSRSGRQRLPRLHHPFHTPGLVHLALQSIQFQSPLLSVAPLLRAPSAKM